MKSLFTVSAVVTLVLGMAWLFLPATMLSLWDAPPDGIALYVGRRYGALLIGFTVILWHSRGASRSSARSAILAGGAIATAMMAILSLIGVVSAVVGPGAWVAFVIEALLSVGFLYYFVTSGGSPGESEETSLPFS